MASLKGIRVSFNTSSQWWSPTNDALFLGVYGTGGGREFRLNGDIQVNQPDKAFSLVLGDPCCPTPNDVPVQYSTGMGDNDPLLNPVELDDIDHVYLRKETTDSTSANDDVLVLQGASVLLCDTEGRLRLWRRDAMLNFSDETGLQQWLGEIAPPTCHVTIRLTRVRHHPSGAHAAGKNWTFVFRAGTDDDWEALLNAYYYEAPTKKDWDLEFDRSKHVAFVGCCGHPQTLVVVGFASERDIFDPDENQVNQYFTVACEKGSVAESRSLDVTITGILNHESIISFDYDLTCTCVD
jgi:hypothetical protein